MPKKLLVLGGDRRFDFVREILSKNYEIVSYADFETAEVIVLPYPITFDSISINAPLYCGKILLRDVFSHLNPSQILLTGGKLPLEFKNVDVCRKYDYTDNEDFLLANAILTAEGLLKLIIEELPTSLPATKIAVVGNGRVGRATASLLQNVGCKVKTFARHKSEGDLNLNEFSLHGYDFDCVVNSVPALVLGDSELKSLKKSCLLLEAASAPYGIDFRISDKRGMKTIIASSLPGKTSPYTAAEIICKSITDIITKDMMTKE